jgi:hypothetical protein
MTIIPGTIPWKETVIPDSGIAREMRPENKSRKIRDFLNKQIARANQKINETPGNERSVFQELKKSSVDTIDMLDQLPSYERFGFGRNTAFVLDRGERLFEYFKRTDFHEILRADQLCDPIFFLRGARKGAFELHAGNERLQCGIEICLDHNVGYLRHTTLMERDLHFVTSAHVANIATNVMLKEDGYLVHASTKSNIPVRANNGPGDGNIAGVYSYNNNAMNLDRIDHRFAPEPDYGELRIYHVQLEGAAINAD